MEIRDTLLYTSDHLWVKLLNNNEALVGISDYGQDIIGDVNYIHLPEPNDTIKQDEEFINVCGSRAESEFHCPLNCKVIDVNTSLIDNTYLINSKPYDSWLIKLGKINKSDFLISSTEYLHGLDYSD